MRRRAENLRQFSVASGEWINAAVYQGLQHLYFVPWLERNNHEADYVFKHDAATAHVARMLQEYLRQNMDSNWSQ